MQNASHAVYSFDDFTLDLSRGCLLRDSRKVKLRNKSLEVLTYLVENRGRLIGKEELIGAVWPDSFVSDESVSQCLMEVRRALSDDSQRYVKTVPRRGYIFDVEVRESGKEKVLKTKPLEVEVGKDRLPTLNETYVEGEGIGVVIEEHKETVNQAEYAQVERALAGRPSETCSQMASGVAGVASLVRKRRNQPGLRATLVAAALAAVVGAAALAVSYVIAPLPPPKVLRYVQITNDGRQKLAPSQYTLPLLSDGSRLYCGELEAGRFILVQVSTTGGETVPLMMPFRNVAPSAISPDRSQLLVIVGNEPRYYRLWFFPLLGGSPRRLTDLRAFDGAWSPDGQRMVYAANESDLYTARSDGSEPRKLASVPNIGGWIRWSPDGRILRFSVYDDGTGADSLWEVSADGTNLHPLLPGWSKPYSECCGDWTPDGKYFLFQAQRDGMTSIWAMREKGDLFRKPNRQPVQLTAGPMSFFAPLPSTDSKKLFVVGVQARGELVRYDAKSDEFVPYLAGISAEHLDFSRDGEWLTYVAYPQATVWRRKVDGSQRLQLTFTPMRAVLPRWSPDGKQIVFMGSWPGKPWKIYLVSSEGSAPQQLIPGERNEIAPSWSPNGDALVFGRHPLLESGDDLVIQRLDLKTHQVSTLSGSNGCYFPVWSPDGRYVAAGKDSKLVLFDSTTQKWEDLASVGGFHKSWSRDGKHLYFVSHLGNESVIFSVGITNRKVERMASLRISSGYLALGTCGLVSRQTIPLYCCVTPAARRFTRSTGKHRELARVMVAVYPLEKDGGRRSSE
jgi:Tol biopolymer transport system component/DNA-binding winged helix-turn-helix (wHTH) protein